MTKPVTSSSASADTSGLPRQPFSWLPERRLAPVLWGFLLLTAVVMLGIFLTNAPLQNRNAPFGMVSWQLAGSLEASQRIVASWDEKVRLFAALNLGLDYLYLCVYGATLSLACTVLSQRLVHRFQRLAWVGGWLAWIVFLPVLLDALENYLLIQLLLGEQAAVLAPSVWWCAVPKFLLVLLVASYLLIAVIVSCVSRPVRSG